MHTTDTVDFDVVVSGESGSRELDDGAEVLLKAGDCVISETARATLGTTVRPQTASSPSH